MVAISKLSQVFKAADRCGLELERVGRHDETAQQSSRLVIWQGTPSIDLVCSCLYR